MFPSIPKFIMNCNHKNSLIPACSLIAVLLFQSVTYVGAQSSPPPDAFQYAKFNPTIAIIIVILVALLFLMGFFSIYIRRRSNEGGGGVRAALSMRRTGRAAAASRGLDGAVIETFPTFVYSAVKGLKIGKGALECAVCLNEYEDEETLRLIPKCDHVFHPECIDAWLENHVTCPVCRANLVPDSGEEHDHASGELQLDVADDEQRRTTAEGEQNDGDSVPIWIGESTSVNTQEPEVLNREQTVKPNRPPESRSGRVIPRLFEKFRSHSTGHSLVQPGENLDRFTLRLPADVRRQVVNRALLNRTGSTVRLAGEGSARKGYRTGVGGGRGRSYKRLGSLDRVVVRSERWVMSRAPSFLTRAFSGRSPKGVSGNAEASTSSTTPKGSKTADQIPLNNIGPKSC